MGKQTDSKATVLSEDGFVIIENYLDPETCDSYYDKIAEVAENELPVAEEYDGIGDLVNWGGAVINKRSGRDDGMWDIFNIDDAIGALSDIKNDQQIIETITNANSERVEPTNMNVYWNRSVTQTRDFHADSFASQYKSFLYLTDVPDKSHGPFSYVRGSHETSYVSRKIRTLLNTVKSNPKTNAVSVNESNVVYCTAPKGTLIIANQAGLHRGIPQEEGKERMLLATSYRPF